MGPKYASYHMLPLKDVLSAVMPRCIATSPIMTALAGTWNDCGLSFRAARLVDPVAAII